MVENNWYCDPQWWAIITALLLGLVGIFQDWLRSLFLKPKFTIQVGLEPPLSNKTFFIRESEIQVRIGPYRFDVETHKMKERVDCYYFRFLIKNMGNTQAKDAEVMVSQIEKKINNDFEIVKDFQAMNLKWSHSGGRVTIPKIQKGFYKYCDLGYIKRVNRNDYGSDIAFFLELEVMPNTGSGVLVPGEYKITAAFTAENMKPVYKRYLLSFPNEWDDNQEIFFKKITLMEI